jgi:hypothetical protein
VHPKGGCELAIHPRETFSFNTVSPFGFIEFAPDNLSLTREIDQIFTRSDNDFCRAKGDREIAAILQACGLRVGLNAAGRRLFALNNIPKRNSDRKISSIRIAKPLIFNGIVITPGLCCVPIREKECMSFGVGKAIKAALIVGRTSDLDEINGGIVSLGASFREFGL